MDEWKFCESWKNGYFHNPTMTCSSSIVSNIRQQDKTCCQLTGEVKLQQPGVGLTIKVLFCLKMGQRWIWSQRALPHRSTPRLHQCVGDCFDTCHIMLPVQFNIQFAKTTVSSPNVNGQQNQQQLAKLATSKIPENNQSNLVMFAFFCIGINIVTYFVSPQFLL